MQINVTRTFATPSPTLASAPTPAPAPADAPMWDEATGPVGAEATPPASAPLPGSEALAASFAKIADDLGASDATLTTMVTDKSPVGAGWAPHLAKIANRLLEARDGLRDAKVADAALVAKLGVDALKLAEASGSMLFLARERATLGAGWANFLDGTIADAKAAADVLKKPAAPAPAPKDGVEPPALDSVEPAVDAAPAPAAPRSVAPAVAGPQPGDIDYCEVPGMRRPGILG